VTPEDTVVCLLTRQDFEASHRERLAELCRGHRIDWQNVFATSVQHGVAPLVYINLKCHAAGLGVPAEVLEGLRRAHEHNVITQAVSNAVLGKALALFNEKGIDVMLVKGAALGLLVYEQPWYTTSGDIDLLIRPRRSELDSADHQAIVTLLEKFNHQRNRYKLHLEYDFHAHHDVTMNGLLPWDAERLWQEARPISNNGYRAMVMAPEDLLLAAAVNSCRHRFFRLKSLCDIAAILAGYPELDWQALAAKAHRYRCNTILYSALWVTRLTLGCSWPDGWLSELKVNPARAALIRLVAGALLRHKSLSDLRARARLQPFGRALSWSLLLTYATYRLDQLIPKLRQLRHEAG